MNDWDVADEELLESVHIIGIIGIKNLELELAKYVDDFGRLVSEWNCYNPFDFYSLAKESLFGLTGNKPVIHGHTPVERIYFDGARLNCDMGSNTYMIQEECGLGLVNLTDFNYIVFKQSARRMEQHSILKY